MTETKIKFKDLSGWLKAAIIITWIMGGVFGFTFLVGFLIGLVQGV
jgi:hypothetical protein